MYGRPERINILYLKNIEKKNHMESCSSKGYNLLFCLLTCGEVLGLNSPKYAYKSWYFKNKFVVDREMWSASFS